MRMSGGVTDGNVNAEQGDNLFELSGGTIWGNIDLGNGNNTINVTGGSIGNGILTGTGPDRFTWSNAETIAGAIDLGTNNDVATLRNLVSSILLTAPSAQWIGSRYRKLRRHKRVAASPNVSR
jgi:autotransporter family porin